MVYKLSVVKTSGGDYLVNHYLKAQNIECPDFTNAMIQVLGYSKEMPEVFEKEPVMVGLSEEEQQIIMKTRELVLEKRVLICQIAENNFSHQKILNTSY